MPLSAVIHFVCCKVDIYNSFFKNVSICCNNCVDSCKKICIFLNYKAIKGLNMS